MPASDRLLFAGVTTSPSRELVASLYNPDEHDRIVLPCVGRWAVATAVAQKAGAEKIEASDLSLFSSVIGYLADPRHSLAELGVLVPPELERFVRDAEDDFELGAGYMLAVKYLSIKASNAYSIAMRNELWKTSFSHRTRLADGLARQVEAVEGCRYDVADVRDVTRPVIEDGDGVLWFCNLPGYKGGYAKQYGFAERTLLGRSLLETEEFEPAEAPLLLSRLTESKALALAYTIGDSDVPAGWVKALALTNGKRTDYIVSNRDPGVRIARKKSQVAPAKRWPIYGEQEITPESVITFVNTDQPTVLFYRDLFVHKLGTPKAEQYCLMLIDGRVVTAFGLHLRDLVLGRMKHVEEVFGISVTSERYARLGKLFMMAITSGQFRTWLMHQHRMLHRLNPVGIQTPSPTKLHEGKTDRGVMKLVRREARPGGGFQLLYQGDFRDDYFSDVVRDWHGRFAHVARDSWGGPRLDPPASQQQVKRRRGRRNA